MRTTANGSSIIAIHVDDMCATASSLKEMESLKTNLRKLFNLVDLGEVKWLLGIVVSHNRQAHIISQSQTTYIEDVAKCLQLAEAHPVSTPLDPNIISNKGDVSHH